MPPPGLLKFNRRPGHLLDQTFNSYMGLYIYLTIIFFCFSFLSQSNQNVTKAVIEAVVADQGGTGNCAWSPAEMKSMLRNYMVTQSNLRNRLPAV